MQHVSAPWLRTVSCLAGCAPEAPEVWPVALRRVVRQDLDAPDAAAVAGVSREDAAVLAALGAGFTSPLEIAAHLRKTPNAVGVRLHRMAKRGLVRQASRGIWTPSP